MGWKHRVVGQGLFALPTLEPVISIATIGDSWAGGECLLNRHISQALRKRGWKSEVSSFSYPGLKGAPIYRRLFRNAAGCVIQADYGVLSVGINDAVAHVGCERYARNAILLLKAISSAGIKPFLIELPRFGQQQAIREEPWHSGLRHAINRYLVDHGDSDTIERYRREFKQALLKEPVLNVAVILFDPDPIIGAFAPSNELWRNPSHLSPAGENALGSAIGNAIALDLERRSTVR